MPHVDLPQAEFKVVLLGDTSAGKTSLVLRFAEGYYRDSTRNPTVGAFFITKRLVVNGLTCKVQIWDTAGQEQFKPLAPMYYQNAAAAIICYDVTSQKSLEVLKYWVEELSQNLPAGRIVISMAACKCDLLQLSNNNDENEIGKVNNSVVESSPHFPPLPTPPSKNQQSPSSSFQKDRNNSNSISAINTTDTMQQQAEEIAQHIGALHIDTSAKTSMNVTELFSSVTERVLQFQKSQAANQNPAESQIPVTFCGGSGTPRNSARSKSTVRSLSPRRSITPMSRSLALNTPKSSFLPHRHSLGAAPKSSSMGGSPPRLSSAPVTPTTSPLRKSSGGGNGILFDSGNLGNQQQQHGIIGGGSETIIGAGMNGRSATTSNLNSSTSATRNTDDTIAPALGGSALSTPRRNTTRISVENCISDNRNGYLSEEKECKFDPTDSPIVMQEVEDKEKYQSGPDKKNSGDAKIRNTRSSSSNSSNTSSKRKKNKKKSSVSRQTLPTSNMMCEGTTDILTCANIGDGGDAQCVIL